MAIVAVASMLTIGMTQAAEAQAQGSDSFVLMRRPLDPKTRTYAWVPGEWSQCSNSCGAGQQTRTVQCTMNGKHGSPDVNCRSERPSDTKSCYDVQACSYKWAPSEWTDAKGCGDVVETRTLSCLRSDGQSVPTDQCPRPIPDTARTVRDLRTCSYEWKSDEWGAWSSECGTGASRTRVVWCERSNGEKVDDAECRGSGAKPTVSENADRYGQCGYSWKEKEWSAWSSTCQTGATRTREVVCLRSNGDEVPEAMCVSAGARPPVTETSDQYGSCSYKWRSGEWGGSVPACGASTRSRTVECLRSNGDVVPDASCATDSKPASSEATVDHSTCTYAWNEEAWGAPSSSCGAAVATRVVNCRSSDGRTVADGMCSGTRPETSRSSYETSGCTHSWNAFEDWSAPVPACGATVQNRAVTCLRSDGRTVADASCDASTRPAGQRAATDYSTCTYGWVADAWGSWSTACGSATQARTVRCQSSDGRTVADASCGSAARPDTSQASYQTSGCGYSWKTGAFGAPAAACGASVQTRDVWCLRSDGERVDDAACGAGRPDARQAATDYSTCSYSWNPGGWSAPSTTCGAATQTRSVTCLRSDGTTVGDGACSTAGVRPDASQSSLQTGSCTYGRVSPSEWSGWDNACSGTATRTRTYQCQRSDGAVVDGSECSARGIPLSEAETGANYTNACPGYFSVGGWSDYSSHCSASATRTRAVTCLRSGDNALAGDQYCTDRGVAVPHRSETTAVFDQCGYVWNHGEWGAPTAACGASARYRAVWCTRSDGTTVADGSCNPATRPPSGEGVNDYSACTYGWTYGGWNTTSQTCGSITQTRSVVCQRSDGAQPIPDGYCGARPPSTQTYPDYSSCTYSRGDHVGSSDWNSHCSAGAVRTNYFNCRRADGAIVDNGECTSRGIAVTEQQGGAVFDQCGYAAGDHVSSSDWNSHCSASAYRTNYFNCRRSDGAVVDNGECTNRGITLSSGQNAAVYDGCGYTWQASGYSTPAGCGAVTATQEVWCQRSDGTRVSDGSCGGGRPSETTQTSSFSSCGYAWKTGDFGGFSSCSASCGGGSQSQTRDVWCERSDGQRVDASLCGGGQPSSVNSQSCNTQSCVTTTWKHETVQPRAIGSNYTPANACSPTGAPFGGQSTPVGGDTGIACSTPNVVCEAVRCGNAQPGSCGSTGGWINWNVYRCK